MLFILCYAEVDVFLYKSEKCTKAGCPDYPRAPFNTPLLPPIAARTNPLPCHLYHSHDYDRRRSALRCSYKTTLCRYFPKCRLRDKCTFAHNEVESWFHPSNLKKMCQKRCDGVQPCPYMHEGEVQRSFRLKII